MTLPRQHSPLALPGREAPGSLRPQGAGWHRGAGLRREAPAHPSQQALPSKPQRSNGLPRESWDSGEGCTFCNRQGTSVGE